MVRRKDRFWEYAEELKGRFRCKFCHKDYPGGIARVKSHLSRQSGRDIAICNSVPEDVQALAFIAVRGKDFPYKKRKAVAYATNSEGNGVDLSLNPVTTCPDSSINLHQDPAPRICNKKDKEVVDKMVAQAFIMNNIPFDVTQSSSFISMVMAVADYGTGYTLPNHNTLCTKLVRDARNEVEEYVSMVKKSWSLTGCTLMSDFWTDVRGCSFINFVAYSAKGTIFLKSFERTDERIGVFVGDMLLSVIDEIGAKNVVQIIVNNSSSYEYASDLVKGRYPQIYKTQCVAHEIQGLLKDFYDGVGWIRSVFDNVELIVDYMYNYDDVLKLLRIHIGDKELKRPCRTRFSSHFVMLQSVIEVKDNLRLMIMSGEWLDVINNKSSMGEQVSRLIESATFWDGVKEVILLLEPLTRVLCLVEGEGSTTGYLYDAMERARSELKQLYTVDKLKYLELWELFNSRWCDRIVHKIHAAAAFFNPSLMYYGKIKYEQPDIRDGMNYVAESLVGINEMDDFAAQLLLYNGRSPKMFNTLSVVMMKKAHPRVWWEDNGGEVPLLRKVAIRILSQPCSFSAFARSWSAFEVAKTKRINKLSEVGLEDLVYARMNSKMMKCYNDLEMKNKFAINLEKLEELHENIDNNYQEIENGEGTATLMLDDIVGPRSPSRLPNSTI